MSSVFQFSRTNNETLQELLRVFGSSRGSAREQWSMQAELLVEPVGWDALWKLSKVFCRKFEVRFPCIAYVSITSVDFENLCASVDVQSVQHETVSLPEVFPDVPLIELWPTEMQREACIDAATTAEFIDLMRFYYNNIWMPWDDQDDKVMLPTTIEERMQLWMEMQDGKIPSCVARSITLLRTSAIDAHTRLQELDSSICEVADEDDSQLPPSYIATCAEMNARMEMLSAQWTLHENPLVRAHRMRIEADTAQKMRAQRHVVALWKGGSIFEFEEISSFLRARVNSDQKLSIMVSAEEALALEPEDLVICSKEYELPEVPLANINICSYNGANLRASETRSCLIVLGGRGSVRDVMLKCARAGSLLLARAHAHVANCVMEGAAPQSEFTQGIVAMNGAKVLIEDTTFDNFYTAIVVHKGAQVELRNCRIKNCGVGIQMYGGAQVAMSNTSIGECSEHCIRCEMPRRGPKSDGVEGLDIQHNCRIGSGDLAKDVLVVQQDAHLL